jgi:hypothetical protein
LECKLNRSSRDKWNNGNKWNERVCGFIRKFRHKRGIRKHGYFRVISRVGYKRKCRNKWNERVCGFFGHKRSIIYIRELRDFRH